MKKLAAIDVGTNSFHLVVVNLYDDGSFETIDQVKEVVRLGEGNKGDIKNISKDAAERAVNALKMMKGIAESHNAEVRAVATSAMREALNKEEVKNKIYEETGVELEIISGHEEARIIYIGILQALSIFDKNSFSFDIGGGSTEFIAGNRTNILYSNSLKLGAVRLSQMFFQDGKITSEKIKECRNWVEGVIYPIFRDTENFKTDIYVGSSGTIMNCGQMIFVRREGVESPTRILNNFEFTAKELYEIEEVVLSRKTTNERKEIPGLETKRADIMPAGIIILTTIFRMLKIPKMTISGYALREGIVIDTYTKTVNPDLRAKVKNVRKESIIQLAASCNFDREHCRHVSILAQKLFDQLEPLHKLESEAKEYLEAASLLHDIGYHISHTRHHVHSNYIIRNSELLGFNESEIMVIANVARYHRKSHPKKSHPEYEMLSNDRKKMVRKLSAIMRIADALDRTHTAKIFELAVQFNEESVIIKIEYEDEFPEIEVWSVNRRKALFEDEFNKKLIIE